MKIPTFILALILCLDVAAQSFNILVFHKTNGFRHSSIQNGIDMFENLGDDGNRWTTFNSQDASIFTASDFKNTDGTYKYEVIVFCNTSGNGLLTATERAAFEAYIKSGGGFIGVHAATDTYRDKSWPFYNELVGGIIQTNPNHTPNNTEAPIQVQTPIDPIVSHVAPTWTKSEEYYYWEINGGTLSTDNTVLLEVQRTGNQTYDAPRPITWIKEKLETSSETVTGFRSFYTALGHNSRDYASGTDFTVMMEKAVLWARTNSTLSTTDFNENQLIAYPNPVTDLLLITSKNLDINDELFIYDLNGKKIEVPFEFQDGKLVVKTTGLAAGIYFYRVNTTGNSISGKFIKAH